MKKITKFFALTLVVMALAITLTACEDDSEKLARITKIKPEVSYGYTAIGNDSITKDFNGYYYENLACKLVRNKEKYSYPYDRKLIGNYMYFYYQYDSRTVKKSNGNEYTSDVGLFRVNINTCKCELVYDFKNVSANDSTNPHLGAIVDENRALLDYNGTISILNLNTLKIADSINCPYYLSKIYDCVKYNNGTLYYYELDGYSFKLHKYENFSGDVTRWENYIYGDGKYDCYDLTTDERVDKDVLFKKMEEDFNKKAEEKYDNRGEEYAYIVGGQKYYLYFYGSGLTIYDENMYVKDEDNHYVDNENSKLLYTINIDYLKENSQAFNDLYYLWEENISEYKFGNFWVIDGKIFVAVYAEYLLAGTTPAYIFECDLENNEAYYVGFSYESRRISDLQLH